MTEGLGKAISNRDVAAARFETVPFEGEWLAAIGRPELRGSWLVFGQSGSGKTTFALQLARYLSRFARVAYNTLEQGLSLSFQSAWIRAGMEEAGSAIVVLDKEPLPQLRQRLARRRSPQVIIIDSLTALPGFTRKDYLSLVGGFPGKLFVFLAHERKGLPDPAIAETVRRLSEVKIYVEGFRAHISSRYACPERGEGVSDYIIWRQGADEYHLQNI